MLPAAKIRAALAKPFLPVVFFFAGVTYDTVTLTRIDRLLDNLILLFYLSLLGLLIVLTGRSELGRNAPAEPDGAGSDVMQLLDRARPYYSKVIQFLLGGLFSAYTIFYSRSASLTTTAVFFAVLVAFLVANEFLRDRLSSVRLLVTLYALVTFCFFTFFLPVLTGLMNTAVFLLGAVVSGLVTLRVVELIYQGVRDHSRKEVLLTSAPAIGTIVILVGFYFLNWIPPVPLSLKFGGIYHKIAKADDRYQLSFERAWYQFWKRSDDPFRGEDPVYCFTAVFAPVDLRTTIYHHWQYRPESGEQARPFMTADRIPISISGGRAAGYRAYTVKQSLNPGDWRVDVETEDGRVVGRVTFRVEERIGELPELRTITY
ncbi:MAG: hypothetical protein AUI21_11535 [Nitrospirae bacterium 13_1_40CM_2_62_10]|nr:MAG: hypothetical protein AUI21_11535 [Nitrospirae bacterium 13_1_40CM_2_62_10]